MIELFVGMLVGGALCSAVTFFWMKAKNAVNLAEAEAKVKIMAEKLDSQKNEFESMKKQLTAEFENLAGRIFEEKSDKFSRLNSENLNGILKPLGENIDKFRKKVEETYDRESKERFSLEKEVKKLVELNQKISVDANNLTNALRGESKTQGNWGEMILENMLERSGLVKGREYFVQEFLKDANGNSVINESGHKLQPDVIINYPDNRKIIVDSKTSLTAYVNMTNAQNDEERKVFAAEHVKSVKKHIDELSQKKYDDFVQGPDFMMAFIPNESAYIAAMQTDPGLWNYAYDKRVVLISPSNLISALRLVSDLWKREYQSRNAEEIALQGAKLYDKFAGFVDNLTDVGNNLKKAQDSYNSAFNQLKDGRGNLISQAEKLRELGVKPKKSLPTGLIDEK